MSNGIKPDKEPNNMKATFKKVKKPTRSKSGLLKNFLKTANTQSLNMIFPGLGNFIANRKNKKVLKRNSKGEVIVRKQNEYI